MGGKATDGPGVGTTPGSGAITGSAPHVPVQKKRGICRTMLLVIAVLCLALCVEVVVAARVHGAREEAEKANRTFVWPTTGLATRLPVPPSDRGSISFDTDENLWLTVRGVSQADYATYVEASKERGFTVEPRNDTNGYEAYDAEGYGLEVSYWAPTEEMRIELDAPLEMGPLAWPTKGPGALVPAPSSPTGLVETDSSASCTVYVGDTDAEVFGAYVDVLMAAGFAHDYYRDEDSFSATDARGVHVRTLWGYDGLNVMRVSVQVPQDGAADSGAHAG